MVLNWIQHGQKVQSYQKFKPWAKSWESFLVKKVLDWKPKNTVTWIIWYWPISRSLNEIQKYLSGKREMRQEVEEKTLPRLLLKIRIESRRRDSDANTLLFSFFCNGQWPNTRRISNGQLEIPIRQVKQLVGMVSTEKESDLFLGTLNGYIR